MTKIGSETGLLKIKENRDSEMGYELITQFSLNNITNLRIRPMVTTL